MDPLELWKALKVEYPDRTARVASEVEPVPASLQDFLDRLQDLKRLASVANDKCSTYGNPYEKPAEDFSVILDAAQRISGHKARFRWERA
jgi:hypothetical protein